MPLAFGEPFSFDQSLTSEALAEGASAATRTHVLVLGAGLAGLTCAYRYAHRLAAKFGRPVTRDDLLVLEREPSVGGRVRSVRIGANAGMRFFAAGGSRENLHSINLGAVTFQPTAYPRYMALLGELGLRDKIRIIPRRTMVLGSNGHAIHADNLALAVEGLRGLAGRGLFTPQEALELARFYFYMRRVTSPAHFDELLALHDRSVAEWADAFGFSPGVRRKFVEPFVGFTFSTPERISAAFGVLLLGFNLSRPANLAGGMMQLPEALAARLGGVIETKARAVRVERVADGFVTDYLRNGEPRRVHSQALVVALPANVAGKLVREMSERAGSIHYANGHAALLHGKLRVPGELHLWRADGASGAVLLGGEAQSDGNGRHYFNLLTYRGENALAQAPLLFANAQFETLTQYTIRPAVAAPEPNQRVLPTDWGDGLFLAGDCTGLFPSQETAVSSGEQVAQALG